MEFLTDVDHEHGRWQIESKLGAEFHDYCLNVVYSRMKAPPSAHKNTMATIAIWPLSRSGHVLNMVFRLRADSCLFFGVCECETKYNGE